MLLKIAQASTGAADGAGATDVVWAEGAGGSSMSLASAPGVRTRYASATRRSNSSVVR